MYVPRIEDTQLPHCRPPFAFGPPIHQLPCIPIALRIPVLQRLWGPLNIIDCRAATCDIGEVEVEDGLVDDAREDPGLGEAVVGAPVAVWRSATVDAAEDAGVVLLGRMVRRVREGGLGGDGDIIFGDEGSDGGDGFGPEVFGGGGGGEVSMEVAEFVGFAEVAGFF